MSNWKPTTVIGQIVSSAGFEYLQDAGILCTRKDAPQRTFGYGWAYDAAALKLGMVIDCEPIFFDYGGKHWMIELWKGQYGFETGCEIGVYCRSINDPPTYYEVLDCVVGGRPHDPVHGLYYACADDHEMLGMQFILKRKGVELFRRGPEKHWWLTGFMWGEYSMPEDLTMEAKLIFPNELMLCAFVEALKKLGYTPSIDGLTVAVTFSSPASKQPRLSADQAGLLASVNTLNQKMVENYRKIRIGDSNDPNKLDINALSLVGTAVSMFPELMSEIVSSTVESELKQLVETFAKDIKVAMNWIIGGLSKIEGISTVSDPLDWVLKTITEWSNFSSTGFICLPSSKYQLTLVDSRIEHGDWRIRPPTHIPSGQTKVFIVKDKFGPYGSEAFLTYQIADATGTIIGKTQLRIYCPVGDNDNKATASPDEFGVGKEKFEVYGCSNNNCEWPEHPSVPSKGHPLIAAFVLGGGKLPLLKPPRVNRI